MKKAIFLIIGILLISGFAAGSVTSVETKNNLKNIYSVNEADALAILAAMRPDINEYINQQTEPSGRDYPIGETIWQYFITGGSDNSPKAIAPIQDINGDGIADVIVCSEDNNIRCFSGGVIGTGVVLWTHNIYSGNIYSQKGLTIMPDVNGDGYQDVAVGATGGARLVRCISGLTGTTIWTYDTHEYGGGGWVYQVDCKYDYNNDGVLDVLASAGDDGSGTGPNRAFCLNGLTGAKIWACSLGGAGFAVIGIQDCTGDGKPDAVAGHTNAAQTTAYAKGINGVTGSQIWSYMTTSSSVWAVEQTDDFTADGIKDVIIGDFSGYIYGLDSTDGSVEYSASIYPSIITRFAKLNDVNSDGHPDFVPAHSTVTTTMAIDGQNGNMIWTKATADQPWNVAQIDDISGDGVNDVVVGTLYTNNWCYFLSGTDGTELESLPYGEAVDAIYSIPDVVSDGSMEMVAGGRNGKLTCISGGLNAGNILPTIPVISGPSEGIVDVTYEFEFTATDPDGDTIYYYVDWADGAGAWYGPYNSGETTTISHSWSIPGIFNIKAKSKDEINAESGWSSSHRFEVFLNSGPEAPVITGPSNGKAGVELTFTFVTTDVNGDDVYYYVAWDDGTYDEWVGPYASGEEAEITHTYAEKGDYSISAKAKDTFGIQSGWGTFDVSIPRARFSIFSNLLQRFPILFKVLSHLFNY